MENEAGDTINDRRTNGSSPHKDQDVVPFMILPGHSRSIISEMRTSPIRYSCVQNCLMSRVLFLLVLDPTCRYMVTASGGRGFDDIGITSTVGMGFGEAVGVDTGEMIFWEVQAIVK